LHWTEANRLSLTEFTSLLEQTFHQSLDCPALNGVRSAKETTLGFLEGRSWGSQSDWWLLCDNQSPIGCSLLNQHSAELCELVYMGIAADWRGQKLGRQLIQKAIETSRHLGCKYLTSAVDTMNWPAANLYKAFQFSSLQDVNVWLPDRSLKKLVA
jgi:ribosomal protein S18 acetylase RimI-like enzyme